MSTNRRDVYIMRGPAEDSDGDPGWVVPEPAEDVIVTEVLEQSELTREAVEPLTDHVDFDQLHELLGATATDASPLSFSIDEVEVSVGTDGTVTVTS